MNYKKVVSRCISSLTAFTAFLYCFRVPVYADQHYILGGDQYLYSQFYNLGFKQSPIMDSSSFTSSISFSGSINEDGSFTISPNNFSAVTSVNNAIQLGDYSGLPNATITGTLGSTSQTLKCDPNPLNEYIGDDTVSMPKYTCYYYAQNYGTQQDITLSNIQVSGKETGNENTTFSGNFNGSNLKFKLNNLTGTVSGTISNNVIYTLPWLEKDNFNNQILKINAYRDDNFNTSEKGLVLVAFLHVDACSISKIQLQDLFKYGTSNNINYITSNMQLNTINNDYLENNEFNGYVYFQAVVNPTSVYLRVNPDFNFSTTGLKIIPLYLGGYLNMPDEIRILIGKQSKLVELLENGSTTTKTNTNNMNSSKNNMENKFTDINNLESNYSNQLSEGFNNINLNNPIISNNGFINSSSWLAQQFTNLVTPDPINNMIMFSLILGLAMVLIGKMRG